MNETERLMAAYLESITDTIDGVLISGIASGRSIEDIIDEIMVLYLPKGPLAILPGQRLIDHDGST